uniref:Uncharacterized protein n=1 Tax=Rhizophora mucronata TaxID=61149 RepID=A0A2P2NV66_RHIMU
MKWKFSDLGIQTFSFSIFSETK